MPLSRACEEQMPPTACIMTPIKVINNRNGQTDSYVTFTRMKNEAFVALDSLLHTQFNFLFMSALVAITAFPSFKVP